MKQTKGEWMTKERKNVDENRKSFNYYEGDKHILMKKMHEK